jgi:hypothetical protein
MALLVQRYVRHPGAEARKDLALLEVALDEVLARLRERGLDHDVVERDALGELGARAIAAQLVGHLVEPLEHLPEAPGQLRVGGLERARVAVAVLHDLAHEAAEEHGVTRLVHLLRGQEVLLLLARRGVDVRRQVVGH